MEKLTLFAVVIFTINIAAGQDKVQKEFDGIIYELKHKEIREINGKKYKDTFWVELGVESPRTRTVLCRIPEKCKDIEIKSLNADCLTGDLGRLLNKLLGLI